MAGYRRQKADGPNSEEKALDLFAEMMIEKIESISKDWRKPWFTEGALQWPRNLSGREYNGMNALMLMLHCEKEGYKIPRFCTFDCVQRMNKPGKDGQELPRVSVLRGEKSFPVMLTTFTCIHKETREKIKYDDYKRLSDDDAGVPCVQCAANKPAGSASGTVGKTGKGKQPSGNRRRRKVRLRTCGQDDKREPVDMPYTPQASGRGVLFHVEKRDSGSGKGGSKEYAREELVAELGSALVSQRYGMTKHIKEDSCAYLKSWLDELKESPQFIKTTLLDVKRATSLITQRVDRIAQGLDEGMAEGKKDDSPQERTFYSSVAYLQSTDDTSRLDELKDKGDYKGLLALAKEYYDGNGMDEQYTYQTPLQHKGDDLLIEDKDFAVVYNGSVAGTYEVMLKFSEQEVRDHIDRYGIGRASVDVREVARDMTAERFSAMTLQREPVLEMPTGDILHIAYNRDTDSLDVGNVCNAGLAVRHSFPYDYDKSLDANLEEVSEKLNGMEEYQAEEMEQRSAFHR